MGVTLRAEPDHKTLGPRLGGAFKSVMAHIKKVDDSTLTSFVDGGKLEVQGHSLAREEVRIMYTFAGDSSKDLAEKYSARAEDGRRSAESVNDGREHREERVEVQDGEEACARLVKTSSSGR